MGFKKIKAKVKHARGAGPDLILKTLKENFGNWQEALKELSEAEKTELIDKFDGAVEGSGDAITGERSDLEMAETDWGPEDKAAFCKALCPEYFEVEDED